MKKRILSFFMMIFITMQVSPSLVVKGQMSAGTITVNLASFPLAVDPLNVISDAEKNLLFNTHQALVKWENGVIAPAAARKWVVSNGGKTYTFYLHKNSWSNGDPVTADDFVRSWKRVITQGNRLSAEVVTDIIYKAKEYRIGELESIDEIGLRVLDQESFQVELAEPSSYFLSLLTLPRFYPVHAKYFTGTQEEKAAYAPGYCSNGAYQIKEWDQKSYALLVPNPHYTGKKPLLKEVKFTFFPSETGLPLYTAGMVDILESPPPAAFSDYSQDLVQVPALGTGYMYLNLKRPPLNKYQVRKALSLAISRDLLIEKVPGLSAVPATGLIPYGISDGRSGTDFRAAGGSLLHQADGEKAIDLLYEAGYPGEDGMPELDLLVVEGGTSAIIGGIVADMWEMNLGIKVKLKKVNWNEYRELCSTGRFYTARAGWEGDYPDPMTFLRLFHSQAAENFSSYHDPEYDYGLYLAKEAMDLKKRYDLYHALEEKIVGDLAVIPLYFNTRSFLISPSIQNVVYTPEGLPLFHEAGQLRN